MAAYTLTWRKIFVCCLCACFLNDCVLCLKQLMPDEVMRLSNNACIVAATENAGPNLMDYLLELNDVSFADEPFVSIGSISLSDFVWPTGRHLKLTNSKYEEVHNELHSQINIVLFLKKKIDRTCLIQPDNKPTPPVVVGYSAQDSIDVLLEIINDKCGTYRTSAGNLNVEGLHREYILQNKFHVSNVTDNSMKDIYQDEAGSCTAENDDCESKHSRVDDPNFGQNFPRSTKMSRCDRISMPSRNDFFHNYLKMSKPVVITDTMNDWPAMTKWTNDFLRDQFGDRSIHIKLTPGGDYEGVESAHLWDNFDTFQIPDKVRKKLLYPDLVVVRPASSNMNFSDFLDLTESVSQGKVKNISAYLEYSSISQYMPELEGDIQEMPFFYDLLKLQHLNFWLSDGNTLGRLHFDPFDNFLCQISGTKEVILFEPHNNSRLYEGHIPEAMLSFDEETGEFRRETLVDSTSMVMSPVDILKPNLKRFPQFLDAHPLNCTISEGEVLFMPSFWWHEVQSYPSLTEARNLAVNFWYEPFLTKEFPCPDCPLDINPNYRHLL